MVALGIDDFVRATNPSDEYVDIVGTGFQPHQTRVVSFQWMTNQFGDPRSVQGSHQVVRAADGTSALIQSRESELLKVNRFWDVGPHNRTWEDIPHIEFETMEGERIYTVYDDPTGSHVSLAQTTIDEQHALVETIRRQQQQIDKLLEISGLTREAIPTTTHPETDIPEDDSTTNHTTSPWEASHPIEDDLTYGHPHQA